MVPTFISSIASNFPREIDEEWSKQTLQSIDTYLVKCTTLNSAVVDDIWCIFFKLAHKYKSGNLHERVKVLQKKLQDNFGSNYVTLQLGPLAIEIPKATSMRLNLIENREEQCSSVLLPFLMTNEVEINQKNYVDLFGLAAKYDVIHLRIQCENWLFSNIETVGFDQFWDFCKNDSSRLKQLAIEKIIKNLKKHPEGFHAVKSEIVEWGSWGFDTHNFEEFKTIVEACSNLQSLTIVSFLTDEMLIKLSPFLKNVKKLVLEDCKKLTYNGLNSLKGIPFQELTLECWNLTDIGFLEGMPLISLNLGHCISLGRGFEYALDKMPLENLIFFPNANGDSLIPLVGMPLKKLTLISDQMGNNFMNYLEGMKIEILFLRGCSLLTDEILGRIAIHLPQLKELYVYDCRGITEAGFANFQKLHPQIILQR